jgi:hypothetical protein
LIHALTPEAMKGGFQGFEDERRKPLKSSGRSSRGSDR